MFVDTAKVIIQAGAGGKGAVSFRREKYVDKGGPDGGDGGNGGNVIFIGDNNTNTLVDFRYHPELKAQSGQPGSKRDKHGRNGDSLFVKVPLGTLVRQGNELLADITEHGQEVVIAHGGSGGYGNAHFKSSVRQAPRMAELGEAGDAFEAQLELKLIADVGLVGFPNAGKSTFLSVVSNAHPEIASYAFTTLTPNLGVAKIDRDSLLIADIPGLIEGASEGKGLGDAFLRHIERTRVLLHLIDAYNEDVAAAYNVIRQELAAYSKELVKRPEIVALTKCDGLDEEIIAHQINQLHKVIGKDVPLYTISSTAHTGLKEVLRGVLTYTKQAKANEPEPQSLEEAIPTISLSSDKLKQAWKVSKHGEVYEVSGSKIEKFALRTDFDNVHSLNRLRDIMRKMGITHQLERQNAGGSSIIRIGKKEFNLTEQ